MRRLFVYGVDKCDWFIIYLTTIRGDEQRYKAQMKGIAITSGTLSFYFSRRYRN